jgi:DNA repair ATPase RecN
MDMPTEQKYSESFDVWRQLITAVTANATDLPHLETHRARLSALLTEAQDLGPKQASLAADKQEVSKRLQEIVGDGRKLASFMRAAVREQYGSSAEKLTEFRVKPFRGRAKSVSAVKAPVPPNPVVTKPGPDTKA